jgi:hypothetical protein
MVLLKGEPWLMNKRCEMSMEKVKKIKKCKKKKRIASVFVFGTYLVRTLFLKRKKGPSFLWGFSNGFYPMGYLVQVRRRRGSERREERAAYGKGRWGINV